MVHFSAPIRLVVWLSLAGMAAALGSCANPPGPSQAQSEDDLSKATADLQSLYDQMGKGRADDGARAGAEVIPPPPAPTTSRPRVSPMPADLADVSSPTPGVGAHPPIPTTPSAAHTETAQQKRDRLLAELADSLAHRDPAAGDPFSRAVDLTILKTIRPGAGGKALESLRPSLTPPQQETLAALRDLLASMPRDGAKDSSEIIRQIRAASARLAAAEPLRIPTAVLCRRVEAFGKYTPFESEAFLAGRSHAALVYVELANFAQRPVSTAADSEEFSVDLGQELNLYHDADGVLAWRVAEQPVRQTSRNLRHDYFLCQRIDLPPTLTVGRYRLKVVVHDKNSGAQAQAIIPITIVADSRLTGATPEAVK